MPACLTGPGPLLFGTWLWDLAGRRTSPIIVSRPHRDIEATRRSQCVSRQGTFSRAVLPLGQLMAVT